MFKHILSLVIVAAVLSAQAAGEKIGLSIGVEGDGVFWNPVVTKIRVTDVAKPSLAQNAGIVAGDEIVQIEGQQVVGRRANDLKAFMTFKAGETKTLLLRRASGEQFEAKLLKPAE